MAERLVLEDPLRVAFVLKVTVAVELTLAQALALDETDAPLLLEDTAEGVIHEGVAVALTLDETDVVRETLDEAVLEGHADEDRVIAGLRLALGDSLSLVVLEGHDEGVRDAVGVAVDVKVALLHEDDVGLSVIILAVADTVRVALAVLDVLKVAE